MEERERRLRERFGPPAEPRRRPSPEPSWRRHLPVWAVAAGVVGALAAAAVAAFLLLTPHAHTAAGCWWWTARTPGQVLPGQSGCLRGYYVGGGELAEGTGIGDLRLPIAYANPDQPVRHAPCPFAPNDAVVIRYHAVFDDGRTIAVVDDCR